MAKRSRPPPSSSDSSSSDEEEQTSSKAPAAETRANNNKEEEESDDESEGESEDEEEQTTGKAPAPKTPANNNKKEEESDDESEDESEAESGEEEEEGEDEDKSKKQVPYKSKKQVPSASTPSKPASDSETEDEESDSDSEAAKLVTPISSKPMADAPAEKANGKVPFQRIWTSDDEIALLRSLAQFESENGPVKLNFASLGEFHAVVKNKISVDVSCNQLVDKVRRLKKRYSMLAARAENGKPLHFAKPHDQALYDLGKKLWVEDDGSEGRVSNGVAANGGEGSSKTKLQSSKFPDLKEAVGRMGTRFAHEALENLDPTKAETLDKRLKKQKVAELKLRAQEADLLKETLKLLAEGLERATARV